MKFQIKASVIIKLLLVLGYNLSHSTTKAQINASLINDEYIPVLNCPGSRSTWRYNMLPFHDVYGPHPVDTIEECAQVCDSISGKSDPIIHIPNTYCHYYEYGGDGPCENGKPFEEVWKMCMDDDPKCMGVMWNSCTGQTSDRNVNGAWKLMSAGQMIGDADHPTDTCGGKQQALGHWDVFLRSDYKQIHVPNTYCEYYKSGGAGSCEFGTPFEEVWQMCMNDGPDKCMGVMWNPCTGPTSDTTVNGAWHLMRAGQTIGDADHPTDTCGGKEQALGHWDVFLRSNNDKHDCQFAYYNPGDENTVSQCYIYGRKLVDEFTMQYEPDDFFEGKECKTSLHGNPLAAGSKGRYLIHYSTTKPPTTKSPKAPTAPKPPSPAPAVPAPKPPTPAVGTSPSCMSGETGVTLVTKEQDGGHVNTSNQQQGSLRSSSSHSHAASTNSLLKKHIAKVKDLKAGTDTILGLDENQTPSTECQVEAVGSFGRGPVYGNYTSDHFVLNPTTGHVETHGKHQDRTVQDKYIVLTSCPLGVDESGIGFTPFDSDFFGGNEMAQLTFTWHDYLLLHAAVLRVVRHTGAFWFDGSSYKDLNFLRAHAPIMGKTLLQCMKDHDDCNDLEEASLVFIDRTLNENVKQKAFDIFHNIGKHRELGSVSATVSAGKSVRRK